MASNFIFYLKCTVNGPGQFSATFVGLCATVMMKCTKKCLNVPTVLYIVRRFSTYVLYIVLSKKISTYVLYIVRVIVHVLKIQNLKNPY